LSANYSPIQKTRKSVTAFTRPATSNGNLLNTLAPVYAYVYSKFILP